MVVARLVQRFPLKLALHACRNGFRRLRRVVLLQEVIFRPRSTATCRPHKVLKFLQAVCTLLLTSLGEWSQLSATFSLGAAAIVVVSAVGSAVAE